MTKDQKIIQDAEQNKTPIFVLVAKDINSTAAIEYYKYLCQQSGCNKNHLDAISGRIFEFQEWQLY
jgi:hypothetical protein